MLITLVLSKSTQVNGDYKVQSRPEIIHNDYKIKNSLIVDHNLQHNLWFKVYNFQTLINYHTIQ